jgi:hypothetical protein
MKKNRYWLWAVFAGGLLAACSQQPSDKFNLEGRLVNGRKAKSVALYEYLPEYGKLRFVDSAKVENGQFRLSGICMDESESFLRLDNDSVVLPFLLSPADLKMEIGQNGYAVTGTDNNVRYTKLLMQQRQGINLKKELQEQYRKLADDSALTKTKEDELVGRYRNISVELNKAVFDAVESNWKTDREFSSLVFRAFSNELTSAQVDSLQKLMKAE